MSLAAATDKGDPMTYAEVLRLLSYDRETGEFTWAAPQSRRMKSGMRAGSVRADGYCSITVAGMRQYAHRLAWFYVYGEWPQGVVDHIDGNPRNNAISNLRCVSRAENSQNQRRAMRNNKTGFLGVHLNERTGMFVPRIYVDGKQLWFGEFATAEEAHAAYVHKKRELHEANTL